MDWELLRQQKLLLLDVIDYLENDTPYSIPDDNDEKHAEGLRGILHLIDHIQDEAVDLGIEDEETVFGSLKCDICDYNKQTFADMEEQQAYCEERCGGFHRGQ